MIKLPLNLLTLIKINLSYNPNFENIKLIKTRGFKFLKSKNKQYLTILNVCYPVIHSFYSFLYIIIKNKLLN